MLPSHEKKNNNNNNSLLRESLSKAMCCPNVSSVRKTQFQGERVPDAKVFLLTYINSRQDTISLLNQAHKSQGVSLPPPNIKIVLTYLNN
jgi:hypothetical protein